MLFIDCSVEKNVCFNSDKKIISTLLITIPSFGGSVWTMVTFFDRNNLCGGMGWPKKYYWSWIFHFTFVWSLWVFYWLECSYWGLTYLFIIHVSGVFFNQSLHMDILFEKNDCNRCMYDLCKYLRDEKGFLSFFQCFYTLQPYWRFESPRINCNCFKCGFHFHCFKLLYFNTFDIYVVFFFCCWCLRIDKAIYVALESPFFSNFFLTFFFLTFFF